MNYCSLSANKHAIIISSACAGGLHDAFTRGEAVRSISDQKEFGILFEATSFLMPKSECKIRIVMINFGGLQNETLKRHRRATSEKSSLAHPSGRRKEREGVD